MPAAAATALARLRPRDSGSAGNGRASVGCASGADDASNSTVSSYSARSAKRARACGTTRLHPGTSYSGRESVGHMPRRISISPDVRPLRYSGSLRPSAKYSESSSRHPASSSTSGESPLAVTTAIGASFGASRGPNTVKRMVGDVERSVKPADLVDARGASVCLSQAMARTRMLAMSADRRMGSSYDPPRGAATTRGVLQALRDGGVMTQAATLSLEAQREVDAPPRVESATPVEGAAMQARRVPGEPVVGVAAFLDGIQRSQVRAHLNGVPAVHGAVAAAVRERKA